jgi:quinol monooxygenase YgiN
MPPTGIHWIAELTIGDGNLERFKELAQGVIDAVKTTEPDTQSYEWHITEDGKTCYVDEWYANTEAALAHLDGEAPRLLPKLLEVSEFTGLKVYTDVTSQELKEKLASFGAVFTHHCGGFTR